MNPAFAYVYDDFLSDSRFERDISLIETELARRGIEGRIARLAMFRSAKEMVTDLCQQGVKNVVFVGNDRTLEKMMWFLPDLDLTVGYIPVCQPAQVAGLLGIPVGAGAVDVLAARLVEVLDVGRLEDRYFLTEVVLPSTIACIEIEGQYRASPATGGAIAVRNLGSVDPSGGASADPKDGLLEAVIQTQGPGKPALGLWGKPGLSETRIAFRYGTIISKEPIDVFVDGHVLNGFTFHVEIRPKKLRIITGRERKV